MSKTHSSQRQSNFQLQNETALYCIMSNTSSRAQCAAELAGAHYGLQDRIFLNYTTIENEHKVAYARKLLIFRCVQKFSKLLFFLFHCWDILKCLNASMFKTAAFEHEQ